MKKAWKWLLGAIGVPVVCLGLLVLDAHRRAGAIIREADAALARDIAALRSRLPPSGSLAASIDQGHRGLRTDKAKVVQQSIMTLGINLSGAAVLGILSAGDDYFREAGYMGSHDRLIFDNAALRHFQWVLATKEHGAPELREFLAGLDRLQSRRLPVADVATVEHLLDRAELLAVVHQKDDPHGMLRRAPGWRELFSRRILAVKALRQLDDHYKEVGALVLLPVEEIRRAANRWTVVVDGDEVDEPGDVVARTKLRIGLLGVVGVEEYFHVEWEFTRMALLLELFRREQGREPTRLEELVPEYLPQVPVSAKGKPYQLKNGMLYDRDGQGRWSFRR